MWQKVNMKIFKTKVFRNGGSWAIRIPAALRSDAGELYIWATGEPDTFTVSTKPPVDRDQAFQEWLNSDDGVTPAEGKAFTDLLAELRSEASEFENPFDLTVQE